MPYRLREICQDDLPLINRWRNDPEVIGLLGNNFLYISQDVDTAWFEQYLQNRDKAKRFAIVDNMRNRVIGTTQLTGIHAINQSAEFSIAIGDKDYWNKGVGYMATRMVLDHGFNDLNLHRIWLTVLVRNVRAVRLYDKIGFRNEGIQRHCVYKQGAFEDQLMMAVLKEEYLPVLSTSVSKKAVPASIRQPVNV
ncbi:GNAT family N-acetyltransferase [Paraflavitalea pollutisoli]|uniref:GNAT family N-acetyltransferase n=1 Tax=Paraflavitalea pollutisoli TaxID=3034143 RepID=UPI0023EB7BBB|nr:GNAT family protein [Paraflavitalea sp. H1-2-19X]